MTLEQYFIALGIVAENEVVAMRYSKLFRAVWFKSTGERFWFSEQYAAYYREFRKSVVLYSLRRLSLIFKASLNSLNGHTDLLEIADQVKPPRWKRWFSVAPVFPTNPLQLIMDDCTCAEETLAKGGEALTPLREHSNVADYVRFIAEFDIEAKHTDNLRVTAFLGATPPR